MDAELEYEYTRKLPESYIDSLPFVNSAIRIVSDRSNYIQRIDIYPNGETEFSVKRVIHNDLIDDWSFKVALEAPNLNLLQKAMNLDGVTKICKEVVNYVKFSHMKDPQTDRNFRISYVERRITPNKKKNKINCKIEFELSPIERGLPKEFVFNQINDVYQRFIDKPDDFIVVVTKLKL